MKPRRRAAARPKREARPQRGRALSLTSELTIAQAGDLKTRLSRLLGVDGTVAVDASATKRVDTACLQLLAAFVRDRKAAGKAVSWQATAPEFTDTARTLGIAAALGLA
jgi:ABC-type transporter Mla MlaB component